VPCALRSMWPVSSLRVIGDHLLEP
jgi:hypothetical protein